MRFKLRNGIYCHIGIKWNFSKNRESKNNAFSFIVIVIIVIIVIINMRTSCYHHFWSLRWLFSVLPTTKKKTLSQCD